MRHGTAWCGAVYGHCSSSSSSSTRSRRPGAPPLTHSARPTHPSERGRHCVRVGSTRPSTAGTELGPSGFTATGRPGPSGLTHSDRYDVVRPVTSFEQLRLDPVLSKAPPRGSLKGHTHARIPRMPRSHATHAPFTLARMPRTHAPITLAPFTLARMPRTHHSRSHARTIHARTHAPCHAPCHARMSSARV